jgi:hypothetical protein
MGMRHDAAPSYNLIHSVGIALFFEIKDERPSKYCSTMVAVFGTTDLNSTNQHIDCWNEQQRNELFYQIEYKKEPIKQMIDVVDTRHPLYGQRFDVSSEQNKRDERKFITVDYKDNIKLTIPIAATSLNDLQNIIHSKLTLNAIQELVLLAQELNLCSSNPKTSGKKCQKACKK